MLTDTIRSGEFLILRRPVSRRVNPAHIHPCNRLDSPIQDLVRSPPDSPLRVPALNRMVVQACSPPSNQFPDRLLGPALSRPVSPPDSLLGVRPLNRALSRPVSLLDNLLFNRALSRPVSLLDNLLFNRALGLPINRPDGQSGVRPLNPQINLSTGLLISPVVILQVHHPFSPVQNPVRNQRHNQHCSSLSNRHPDLQCVPVVVRRQVLR